MIDVKTYNPWFDPLFVKWEREEREKNERHAAQDYERKIKEFGGLDKVRGWKWATESVEAYGKAWDKALHWRPQVTTEQALWEPLRADKLEKPTQDTVRLALKTGGAVVIGKSALCLFGAAASEATAIETGVLHAKTQWGGLRLTEGGEPFKAQAWAFAQLHGVKVQGYRPTKAARELAKTLTSRRQQPNAEELEQAARPLKRSEITHFQALAA